MSNPLSLPLDWSLSPEAASFGGYVAWEAAHRVPPAAGHAWFLPAFLRLRAVAGGPADLRAAIKALLASDSLVMARDERDLLFTEAERAGHGWPPYEVRLVAYVAEAGLAGLPGFAEVLHLGAPVQMGSDSQIERPADRDKALPLPVPARASESRPPAILAAIDDGIAFLNARFRADPMHTRFAGIWLQAPEMRDMADVICGRTLTPDEINALLASGQTEAEIYRRINRNLLAGTEQQSTNHLVSHGTHVLDLAAGAAPEGAADAAMRRLPILAVQLPPAALRDTSGRRLEGYVVKGLRWLMARTLRRANGGPAAPLVVNLSIGSLAGPGNESAFLADWFQYETQRYARLAPDAVLRIVAAYGNARRARLVARSELRAATDLALDWCILPDDGTPSFAELRAEKQRAGALRLRLQPPGHDIGPLDIAWPQPGECWSVGSPPIAMVTGVGEGGQRMVHVAVAPTAGAATTAPSGRWRIGVSRNDEAPALISVRVQRDDTPAGYRTFGRQSWLDHAKGWTWDDETRDWTAPLATENRSDDCPITRQGTSVAFAGTAAASVLLVGAVRPVTGMPDSWQPTLYTASGVVTWGSSGESTGPTLAARGDDGVALGGRRACGVLSGSVARLSGTSVATPAVARMLALFIDRTPGQPAPHAEQSALVGHPTPQRSPLTGHGILVETTADASLMV